MDRLALAFLFSITASVVVATCFPQLDAFLCYGKLQSALPDGFLGSLASVKVAKSWFWHFYAILLLLSYRSWGKQNSKVRLILLMMQATRRLCEQWFLFSPSNARMHLTHYLVGIGFYVIQGASNIPDSRFRVNRVMGTLIFAVGWVSQLVAHYTLAHTERYNLPIFPIFGQTVACPHYGAEIAIYAGLAILSNFELTTVASLLWVVTSLCVSGERSRGFYLASLQRQTTLTPPAATSGNLRWAVLPQFW